MKNIMEYNGYTGIVEYSAEDGVFFGKVFGINDVITFEGDSVKQLEKAFREAVNDYVETCQELGKEPERAYKGSFNVRINPEVHRRAAFKAQTLHISLNEFVEQAIAKEVEHSAVEKAGEGIKEEGRKNHDQRKHSVKKKQTN